MKTTVDIPDSLLDEARSVADKEGTSVKVLVEEGLRRVILERKKAKRFRLRKTTFRGKGVQPEVTEGSWEKIREMIFEGRGA